MTEFESFSCTLTGTYNITDEDGNIIGGPIELRDQLASIWKKPCKERGTVYKVYVPIGGDKTLGPDTPGTFVTEIAQE